MHAHTTSPSKVFAFVFDSAPNPSRLIFFSPLSVHLQSTCSCHSCFGFRSHLLTYHPAEPSLFCSPGAGAAIAPSLSCSVHSVMKQALLLRTPTYKTQSLKWPLQHDIANIPVTDLLMYLVQICKHLFREDIKEKFNRNKISYIKHDNETKHKPEQEKYDRISLHTLNKFLGPFYDQWPPKSSQCLVLRWENRYITRGHIDKSVCLLYYMCIHLIETP